MKLIAQTFDILQPEGYTMNDVFRQIERCARTCYKSEDRITNSSAEKFVDTLIASGHVAMLEHGTIYLKTTNKDIGERYEKNKYSETLFYEGVYYITTNYRVVLSNRWTKDLVFMSEPTLHIRRATVKITTNRQVANEFVRHRVFSFAQESTRFCNYSKGKFGKELTFIKPWWWSESKWIKRAICWLHLWSVEKIYMLLVRMGCSAQEAAQILPNATKTELVMTGTDWDHFFDLRVHGVTGRPHPQAQDIAIMMMYQLLDNNII